VTADDAEALRWPRTGPEDERAVLDVLHGGDLSTAGVLRELEADYAAFTGRRHALAHANGTAALLAAFWALDLQPGDEVIVQSATFWASALPMVWVGAVPVFCESEAERLGPCPEDVEARITERTRALVVTHLWGLPARMGALLELARRHDLRVIEDASHAHGATWRDRPIGSLGDLSVFSLQGDKLAPAGEGALAARVRLAETLGAETLVHLALAGGTEIVARREGAAEVPPAGTEVGLACEARHLHLFDGEGRRVEPAPA